MYLRHELSAPAEPSPIFVRQLAGFFVERARGVRLDEQTRYRDQHIAQLERAAPVALERLNAHGAGGFVHIRMPASCAEEGCGGCRGIGGRDVEV